MARKLRGAFRALDLTSTRGRRKGKGPAGMQIRAGDFSRRGKRRSKDLSSWLRLDKKSERSDRRSSLGAKAARAMADRMTRTERLQVEDAIAEAQRNDPVVSAAARDAQRVNPTNRNVVQRLVSFVRDRLSSFRGSEP